MRAFLAFCFASFALAPAPGAAQLRIVHDTLGRDMPTSITCGFCAGERFGVIFRELPGGRRGLEATDFPLTIDSVEVALGSATVESSACVPQATGGVVLAQLAIYAGDTPPTGSILALPEVDPWPGETLVWASDEVPITLSVENAEGMYEVQFNQLEIRDEMEMPVAVESGAYLRVVFTLPSGAAGSSDICTGTFEPAGGYPVRDDDGRIAAERNFIYAGGMGWFWNEAVPGGGIGGDWGVRLGVFPSGVTPMDDAGTPGTDGGAGADGGAGSDAGADDPDGGVSPGTDAGDGGPHDDGGCGCRAAGRSGPTGGLLGGLLLAASLRIRRRSLRRGRDLG